MGRKCKLQDTGETGDTSTAYKAPDKKYYSSKEAYEKIAINSENRMKCISKLMDILGYKQGMKLPTITYKKIKEYEVYGYDVLYETILRQEKSIQWALTNKQFTSETSKISYIMAILQNNVMDSYKDKVALEKAMNKSLKQDTNSILDLDIGGTKKQSNDVSNLLGGDLWI